MCIWKSEKEKKCICSWWGVYVIIICPQLWMCYWHGYITLQWRHNGRDSVSNHQPHDCLLNRLFRCRSKKTSKLHDHWPLCAEFIGDHWIPRTNGQLRGKSFHLMTSSCRGNVTWNTWTPSSSCIYEFAGSDRGGDQPDSRYVYRIWPNCMTPMRIIGFRMTNECWKLC